MNNDTNLAIEAKALNKTYDEINYIVSTIKDHITKNNLMSC